MAKAIQTISECRKLIREVNEQVRKANEADNIDVKNKSLSKWASNMAGKLKKKFRAKSAQYKYKVGDRVLYEGDKATVIDLRTTNKTPYYVVEKDKEKGKMYHPAYEFELKPLKDSAQNNEATDPYKSSNYKYLKFNKNANGKIIMEAPVFDKVSSIVVHDRLFGEEVFLNNGYGSNGKLGNMVVRTAKQMGLTIKDSPKNNNLWIYIKDNDIQAFYNRLDANIKEFRVESIQNEAVNEQKDEIIDRGKTQAGYTWTRTKIDRKTVNILGVDLAYDIVKFHVDMPKDSEKSWLETDRIEYNLVNSNDVKIIQKTLENKVFETLGKKVSHGSGLSLFLPEHGEIKE